VVLGLGLLALAVDRLLLGGQTDAVREAVGAIEDNDDRTAVTTPVTDTTTLAAAPPVAMPLNVVLARRFERMATARTTDSMQVPDAFEPAATWLGAGERVPPDAPTHISPSEFLRRHALQAIMVAGGRDCAIVSRQLLYPGDSFDGWLLESIGERTVTFRAHDDMVILELDQDEPAAQGRP
jgi:hypothetical protein